MIMKQPCLNVQLFVGHYTRNGHRLLESGRRRGSSAGRLGQTATRKTGQQPDDLTTDCGPESKPANEVTTDFGAGSSVAPDTPSTRPVRPATAIRIAKRFAIDASRQEWTVTLPNRFAPNELLTSVENTMASDAHLPHGSRL